MHQIEIKEYPLIFFMSAGLHFISTIGEVSDTNFVETRNRIANDNPGSCGSLIKERYLPRLLETKDLLIWL